MKKILLVLSIAACGWFIPPAVHAFPIITDVVETGGDNEATDTVTAKWTGVTFVNGIANEPLPNTPADASYTVGLFGNHAPSFVDRNHRYTNAVPAAMPAYLIGGEYIMAGNDNRDNAAYTLDVTVAGPVHVYMLIDNRLGAPNSPNTTPPQFGPTKMQWILDEGWTPVMTGINRTGSLSVPDEIGLDEGADGSINQYYSIYTKLFPAGTFRLKQPDNAGQNMYGVVITSAAPPETPENLTAASGDTKVTLNWSEAAGADSYIVKRSSFSGGPYDTIATPATTSYMDTDVINELTYYYVVSAVNGAGESANSAEVIGRPRAAPANLVAVGGTGQVQLTWSSFPGAASYTVLRSDTSGGPYASIATGVATAEYLDTAVEGGRTYYYVVVAQLIVGGDSGQSSEAAGTTAPNAPVNVAASLYAATVIRISWTTADPVVTEFALERAEEGSPFVPLTTVPASQRRYEDANLLLATTYHYRVRAINGTGASDYSAVATATTPESGWNINFANALNGQPANDPAPTPAGYLQDVGLIFGDRGNGYSYGWDLDITADGRWRKAANSPDLRYDTLTHLIKVTPPRTWELDIPNGFYWVRIVAGDPSNVDSVFQFNVEGVLTATYTPVAGANWGEFTNTCVVSDGRLTITSGPNSQTTANNNKICFIDIYPAVPVPVGIDQQPQPQTVDEFRPLMLSVTVTNGPAPNSPWQGAEPITYQWYRNGEPVAGANSATLSIPLAQTTDAGTYYVTVTNPAGSETSESVEVVVNEDFVPPQIVSVASLDGRTISVCFNELLDLKEFGNTATERFSYLVDDGANVVDHVVMWPDGKSVVLHLEQPLFANFKLYVEWVEDAAGNALEPLEFTNQPLLGWDARDIGVLGSDPLAPGSALACGLDRIEVQAGGTDIWNAADAMHYVSQALTGDFDLRVRLESLLRRDPWTKAGLMAREDLDANSRHIAVIATPGDGQNVLQTITRATKGGASTEPVPNLRLTPVPYPNAWMRLKRQGNTFTTYHGDNGVDWTLFVTHTPAVPYPATLHVGLATTSHNNASGQTTLAVYRDFGSVIGAPTLNALSYAGGTFSLSFATQAGVSYVVEYKDDLNAANWTTLETILGDGSVRVVNDASAGGITRFYQVRLAP